MAAKSRGIGNRVQVTKGTKVLLPNGKHGSFADLEQGDRVVVSGLQNRRTGRFSVVTSIRVLVSRTSTS